MTRLLLDIDGVLNAVDRTPGDHWRDWQTNRVLGFPITYSTSVIQFFCQIAQVIDVVWLTTWGQLANDKFAPMVGMPVLAVAGEPYGGGEDWWKLDLARALYEKDQQPFIWLDDDIRFDPAAVDWLAGLPEGSYLAISPATSEGLRPEHLDMIAAFIVKGA